MTDAPLTDKLAKFVRLLSSDQDGEVIAAAGAIRRTLLAANLDIHDLAKVVERSNIGNGKAESERSKSRPGYDPFSPNDDPFYQQYAYASAGRYRSRRPHDEWGKEEGPADPLNHRRATYCYQFRRTILNGREAEFITDMIAQSLHHRLTPRQAEWLKTIWRKCQPFNFDDVG